LNQFPQITISGSASERGLQHGTELRDAIIKTIEFYRSIFKLPEAEILQHAAYFQGLIKTFNPEYLVEINAIAKGADVDPLWIVALNSRTEILSQTGVFANECTAMCFVEQSILGQTWDWGLALEPLTVLMTMIQPDGHKIRMITEPGIIGKIGMNSIRLGVCLNILTLGKKLDGLPIHILLRAVLDCRSLNDARVLLERHASGKASNLIVADANGNGFDMEFCGDDCYFPQPNKGVLLHTNHYLGASINSPQNPDFFSSFARFDRATALLETSSERSVAAMCNILSDDSDVQLPIYRDYVEDASVHELGTVCSIVMSLTDQTMMVRKGKGQDAQFYRCDLQ